MKTGDVVRLQSKDGFKKKGVIVRKTELPRSYIVEPGSREYRRNRRHILKVDEPPETVEMEEPEVKQETHRRPRRETHELGMEEESVQETQDKSNDECEPSELRVRKTRSGRVVKPPNRLNL